MYFSAIAYYFGRKVQGETGYPVGLVHASIGGTVAQAWTRREFIENDDKVTLKGKIDGRVKEWEIDVTDIEQIDLPIPILWARDRIRDLEESNEVFVGRGSRQTERKEARVKDMILDLSKKYNLLSRLIK